MTLRADNTAVTNNPDVSHGSQARQCKRKMVEKRSTSCNGSVAQHDTQNKKLPTCRARESCAAASHVDH